MHIFCCFDIFLVYVVVELLFVNVAMSASQFGGECAYCNSLADEES